MLNFLYSLTFTILMLLTFLSIIGAIGILLVIVVVHEAGHFFAARYFGMQTPVVGLGLPFFGPTWKIGKIQDVEFRLHPLLLGAYV
ncbi:MAG: site-2 protease family protein, partial [Candidatus Melainabacteria bacterium]